MWPLYRESLLQGPSHVSLAIPGVPSNISKSVGGTQPALLLFPNLEFLQSFIKGNVGIADGVLKGSLLSNINALAGSATIPSIPSAPNIPNATIPSVPNVPTGDIPSAANAKSANIPSVPNIPNPPNIPKVPNSTEMGLKMFIKSTELDIPDLDKYKKDGQIKIPAADIQLPPEYDYIGLKAMEKTIMTSIFETQKPYMDIAKVIISSMVKVEDIIARVMPLLSLNPLTSKSEKPTVKDGKSNGTKAIGYQNGLEIKKILAELEKLSKIGGALTVNKDGTTSKDKKTSNSSSDNPNPSDTDALEQGKEWRIISTFYSTGDFDPTIEYLYTYNILPPDEEGVNNLTPEVVEPDNPFDKYKPKKIILGLFNADGTPLNPNGLLKTKIGDKPEDIVDSKSKKADWVFDSPKWHFKPNEYIWPSFGGSNGQPIYLWEGPLGVTQESKTSPGNSWSIKKYKEGDENKLNKLDAIEDDPIIVRFDASDTGEYIKYFKEFTMLQTNMSKDLDQAEKNAIVVDIMSKLDVQSHLQNVFLYGSGQSSYYKAPGIPDAMKKSFKPYQIYVSEATKDPNLSGDGLIWVDPEADYEFKVIRVDVYPDSEYEKNVVKNDILKTDDLFSDGFYGNGTKDNPQEIEIIKRYSLTNLDIQSYYIIEGIAVDDNKKADGGKTNADASGDDGNKWYRLPHAIGAVIPFIKLLIDLAVKLFPSIAKLLKLFTNPMSFITDTISEKVGDAFAIFSKEAFKKFEDTKKIIDKKKDIIDNGRTSDYSGQIKKNFNTSPLVGHVHVDQFSMSNPGKFKFLLDGVAMIPFEIFGKSLPFGMELKMANLIPEVPNINVPKVDLPKVDVPKVPDINGSIPTTTPTVPNVSVPKVAIPNVGIPSITLPKVQSPLKLILGKPGKAKTKDCDGSNQTPPATGKSNSDYLNALNNPATDNNQGNKPSKGNANDKFVTSTWYSTGEFKKGVDYNYYYITEDTESILLEVDNLIKPSGSSSEDALPGDTNANNPDNTPVPMEDLQLAKEILSNALSKDPTNPLLKLKLSEVNQKILDSATLTQPILKLALGMVATPIKVVSCIVQWILDFFKSLINPMMLPAKIVELLSFKWIMKFFSPDGLLKTAGINFNPAIVQEWVSLASIPNANIPATPELNTSKLNIPKVPDVNVPSVPNVPNVNIPNVTGANVPKVDIPKADVKIPKVDLGFSINSGTSDILKNIKPHNGKYALPDDFEIADLTKFLDVSFMASLPTYDAKTIRENPKLPFMIFDPVLCFIEKLINAFIDFIWSTLGIEAIIPPPHIKLCKTKDAKEVNKLQNGESPKVPSDTAPDNTTEIDSTMPYQSKKASDAFVYEIQLPDGKIVTLKNDEELQNYLDQNRDLGFDLQF